MSLILARHVRCDAVLTGGVELRRRREVHVGTMVKDEKVSVNRCEKLLDATLNRLSVVGAG